MFFVTQFFVSFITIFLRGLQTQNVIHGNYKGAAITSLLMSISNVAFIGLIAVDPYASLIPTSIGSVLGVVLSMYLKRRQK